MLDPSNDFNAPCYDDNFRRNFYFREYKNYEEYFIELDYWIMREAFTSRIGRKLDIKQKYYDDSGAGEEIFRDISSAERKRLNERGYFVGDEIIDDSTSKFGDIYHVTEVYVYAPKSNNLPKVFASYSTEVVNFPKIVDFDFNYSKEYHFGDIIFLCGLEEIGFISEDLTLGDEFYMERPEQRINRTDFYSCRSSTMTITRREGDYVWAKASGFTNPYNGTTYSAQDVVFKYREFDGIIKVCCPTKTYGERALQVTVRKESIFSTDKPEISEKFFPKDPLTNIEVDQIDSGTVPNFTEYNTMISNGTEIISSPSVIEEVYNGLWRCDNFYTVAR